MSQIQLVVFDMAGTTVRDDGEVERCFLDAADRTGLQATAKSVNAMMGWSKKRVFDTLWVEQIGANHPELTAHIETSFVYFKEVLEHHYRSQSIKPTEGCLEAFSWLKSRQIKIALNTGFYREVTDIILQRLGWDQGLNDQYIGSDQSVIQASVTPSEIMNYEGRPAPFMIQKAMYRLDVKNPQQVIHIGDTPTDLATGFNAHCLCSLGVINGTHTREQLAQYPNHGLLASLNELPETIQMIGRKF
jgi:phosphonatase-like hydrolase